MDQLDHKIVRSYNSKVIISAGEIMPIRLNNEQPPNFPVTAGALDALLSDDVIDILGWYGVVPEGDAQSRTRQLKLFLGSTV